MLTTERIHHDWSLEDIFGDGQWCPVCLGKEFTHVEGEGITCDRCGSKFELRMTAGDPGVVVDCLPSQRKYIIQRSVLFGNGEDKKPYFYQVLKQCERGLDDRETWITNLDIKDLGEYRFMHIRQDDGAMGQEIFYFEAHDVAGRMAFRNWKTRTKAGQEMAARWETKAPNSEEDPEGHKAWWDEYQRLTSERYKYVRTHKPKIVQRLKDAGYKKGYYLREQCAEVFDDCMWIHRCIPKDGEEPVRPARH
jgi:hypothetical protein